MFEQILAALAALQQQVVDLQASQAANEQAKYDEGYAKGLADGSQGGKIYSQEELDQAIAAQVNPLKDEIAALKLQVDALAADKAAILADVENASVDDLAIISKWKK